jgi:hypothetical protein
MLLEETNAANRRMLDRCKRVTERMTFEGIDPAVSDHAAQEYRDTLIRHVLRGQALATKGSLDPDAYLKDW